MAADGANLAPEDFLFAKENLQKAIEILRNKATEEKLAEVNGMIAELSEYQNEAGKAPTTSNWVDKIKQPPLSEATPCCIL
jgi:hypothetical protein